MIRALGLLTAGATVAGLLLAHDLRLMLVCWASGAVVLAGLAAVGRDEGLMQAAREGLLVEIFGAWALALAGLGLALAAGSDAVDDLSAWVLLDDAAEGAATWAGAGLLVAVACRLGLPPVPPWPVRAALASPAVRIFLHAGLHPLTALILWDRLDGWLLPWHREAALWLGAMGAVLLALAAAGERHGVRRAAYLGAGRWAALLATASFESLPAWLPWLVAAGLALVHTAEAMPRWTAARRRGLLAVGIALTVPAGAPAGMLSPVGVWLNLSSASMLLHAATLLTLVVGWSWWRDLGRPLALVDVEAGRDAAAGHPVLPGLTRLARRWRRPAAAGEPVGPVVGGLSRVAAGIDRHVLDGAVEGMGLITQGTGWLVAWLDRRGLDAAGHGLGRLVAVLGAASEAAVNGRPGRSLAWVVIAMLAVTLLLGLQGGPSA
jgi:hypothetical protein